MIIQPIQHPFPYLIVDNLYTQSELNLIWKELEFLNVPSKWNSPEKTGSAHNNNKIIKNNFGLFLDGPDGIYMDRKISNILSINRKITSAEILCAYAALSFGYQSVLKTNVDRTLVSYYEDGHYYDRHQDFGIMTALTWVYKEPKSFIGGNLIFSHPGTSEHKIEIKNNRAVLFPSFIFHGVENVKMMNNEVGFGRYCISQFFSLEESEWFRQSVENNGL